MRDRVAMQLSLQAFYFIFDVFATFFETIFISFTDVHPVSSFVDEFLASFAFVNKLQFLRRVRHVSVREEIRQISQHQGCLLQNSGLRLLQGQARVSLTSS